MKLVSMLWSVYFSGLCAVLW
uniref:Uncharacterized protein n=1 Tax=Rhizophora mucronata TaxID=61149 RepID=A0A2P2NZ17_RHIMU